MKFYLNHSKSRGILILDGFFKKLENIMWELPYLEKIVVASISDELSGIKKAGLCSHQGEKDTKGTVQRRYYIL